MNSKHEAIDLTISHISDLLDQLNHGNELSKQECLQVINDLEHLQALSYESGKGVQIDMDIKIDDMLNEFNDSADDSKALLQTMLALISEGRVPQEDDVKKLDSSIACLRQKYNSIYSAAMAQLPCEEMPDKGAPASEYVEAVRNSISMLYKKQLEGIKRMLEDFVAVQSFVSNYATALRPYQQQAETLISEISDIDVKEVESLEQKIARHKAFLDALKCKDLDSDEGMDLLDRVSEYYPCRVQYGLAARKYYIPEKDETDETEKPTESESNPQESEINTLPDTEMIQKTDKSQSEELPMDTIEDNIEGTVSVASESEPEEVSAFARKVIDSGLLLSESDNVGLLTKDVSPNEEKKITASIFQNDVKKGHEKAIKVILKEIHGSNNLAVRLLTLVKGMPEDLAKSSLDYLHKKGYLIRYILTPGGEFYCASSKLMKALFFKEAAKMIGVHQRSLKDWGENIEDKNTSAASRIVLLKLYCESVKRFIGAGKTSFTEHGYTLTDSFLSMVFPADKSISCDINIGEFWDNIGECDKFIECAKKIVECDRPIGGVVFAALNLEKARLLADIVLGELGDAISYKEVYLYSLSDDRRYIYTDGDIKDVSEILPSREALAVEKDNSVKENASGNSVVGDVTADAALSVAEEKTYATDTADVDASSEPIRSAQVKTVITPSNNITKPISASSAVTVDVDKFYENIISMINSGKLYAASAYAKAFTKQCPEYTLFYNQLAYALNDPMEQCNYSTDNAFSLIENRGELDDALVVSTAVRTFFSNQVCYDYNIKSYYSGIKGYKLLSDYPELSKVLYTLMKFKDNQKKGMDAYADYRSKSKAELDFEMRKLQQEAHVFYENFVTGRKKEKASQKRFLETKKLIFSAKGDFGEYIKAIVDGEDDLQPCAYEFLKENFYKEDVTIEENTIDTDKLWKYIVVFWEKAGELMMYRRHADLMSHLRSNIISATTKAVQLIARWCNLVNRISNHTEDEGDVAYKRARKPLIDNLEKAIGEMRKVCKDDATNSRKKAGLNVLIYTLQEILECVNGSYTEDTRKYFYVPFLLTDDLMLNEDYLPDLEMHSSTLQTLDPMVRILQHVSKVQNGRLTLLERLTATLDEKGDDYGAARLIVDYLMSKNPSEELTEISANIDNGVEYAKEKADLHKADFVGNLELAQSYGQIDNSVEDKKERILQIIDEWYEWAVETSNFGFFKCVMDAYIAEIKEEAKTREKDLIDQMESFKSATIPGLSAEAKEKRAARILEMINVQNYTVAEDLLARANASEDEYEEFNEEDFLQEFLDNYDDYYQPVAKNNVSFSSLVSKRTRNKEERGAKRLADNWLPGGSLLGKERLKNLLACFGFKVDSIKPQDAIGKFEHFFVQTAKTKGGQRDNYTHPIAAFGSGAAQDGFRVVCVNGAYDSDSLIDVMKKIGNAKHTLILLDYALSMSERRRLARKAKNALGDKLFGVVDRTVMMFLVRNYDETKINRMLISLITPFGYYQPYVWESANVMPPEIFMGRKHELEKIKSPTGVNIVYGGRQLGKSALLKKAKEDIDWDENGNRAVLVDVKSLNYKKAAKKIGHALYDADVLETDIDTEDWDDLARAVRRRLQSDKNRIPYLLLLLDEADAFIDSCGEVNYQPLDALKEIQSIGTGRFKFVIAGLRNVVRFKREALGNNSVLTHLESMTVKPFNTSEARELMEIPLHYLGLRFPKDKEYLITLILATTNYFPGLIQLYCAKLIDAMRNKDYANYDEVNTPIYEVSENHIKKVLADPEFTQQIREKYIITLKLDEDNYYYLIALLMAFLYHNNGYSAGYSAADIKKAGVELEIAKIATLENAKLESLMEELKELNVLRNTDETHYLFTRFTFFQMMGTCAEVDDKLEEYMGG